MFNKQLKQNIKALDLEIGKLSKEINGLNKDTKYEVKARTLSDLIDFRCKLAKGQDENKLSDVVIELDKQIAELTMMVARLGVDEAYAAKLKKLEELSKIRSELSECMVKESNTGAIVSGVVGVGALLLVLSYEENGVITSKNAFNIAMKMFKFK